MKRIFRRLLSLYVLIGLGLAHQAYPMQRRIEQFHQYSSDTSEAIAWMGFGVATNAIVNLAKTHTLGSPKSYLYMTGVGLVAGLTASGIRNILSIFPATAIDNSTIIVHPNFPTPTGPTPGIALSPSGQAPLTTSVRDDMPPFNIHASNPRQENTTVYVNNNTVYATPTSNCLPTGEFQDPNNMQKLDKNGPFVLLSPQSKKKLFIKALSQLASAAALGYLAYKM